MLGLLERAERAVVAADVTDTEYRRDFDQWGCTRHVLLPTFRAAEIRLHDRLEVDDGFVVRHVLDYGLALCGVDGHAREDLNRVRGSGIAPQPRAIG